MQQKLVGEEREEKNQALVQLAEERIRLEQAERERSDLADKAAELRAKIATLTEDNARLDRYEDEYVDALRAVYTGLKIGESTKRALERLESYSADWSLSLWRDGSPPVPTMPRGYVYGEDALRDRRTFTKFSSQNSNKALRFLARQLDVNYCPDRQQLINRIFAHFRRKIQNKAAKANGAQNKNQSERDSSERDSEDSVRSDEPRCSNPECSHHDHHHEDTPCSERSYDEPPAAERSPDGRSGYEH